MTFCARRIHLDMKRRRDTSSRTSTVRERGEEWKRDEGGCVWIRSELFEGEVRTVWKWWKSFLRHCQPPPVLPCFPLTSHVTSSSPFVAVYRRTWGLALRSPPHSLSLSILILLFHSASSVFRASPFLFFPFSLSLSLSLACSSTT